MARGEPAKSQEPETLQPDACPTCRVELEQVLKVAGISHPALPGPVLAATADRRGYRYFTFYPNVAEIRVFSPDGDYDRTLGREGQGPGEYQYILVLAAGRADSLWVYDAGRGWTILDSEWRPARTFRFFGESDTHAFLPDGDLVVGTMIKTVDRLGYPLHRISSTGEILASFGTEDGGVYRTDMAEALRRLVAPAQAGGFWAAHRLQYVLERWQDDTLVEQLVRQAEWFPPAWTQVRRVTPDGPPPRPWITDIYEDDAGLLWVASIVTEPDWREAFSDEVDPTHGQRRLNSEEAYGSRLEVIDPQERAVLASVYTDETLEVFLDDGTITGYREDGRGTPTVTVYRPTLIWR